MNAEGIGLVAPKIWKVSMDDGTMGMLISEAKIRAEQRGYGKEQSQWKRGLKPSIVIANVGVIPAEVRPIFVGFMGEHAVNVLVQGAVRCPTAKVDFTFKRDGDGGTDLLCFNLRLQVKTCQDAKLPNLIRVRDEKGFPKPFTAHACAFCEWYGFTTVGVRGWCWWRDVKHLPEVDAIFGGHKNIEVPSEMLLPVSALVDELEARRLATNGNH